MASSLMASSLMASQATILQPPLYYRRRNLSSISLAAAQNQPLLPRILSMSPTAKVSTNSSVSASSHLLCKTETATEPPLTGSTRALATLFAVAIAAARKFFNSLGLGFHPDLVRSAGPMFFAAAKRSVDTSSLNTPLTVIAAGMGKWLDIYSGVLMVRVLLSWFPNIPWEKQPLSAIRDLCDPYLNLFRNIIPPVFDTLDVSPLLAFAVLGTLGSILSSTKKF